MLTWRVVGREPFGNAVETLDLGRRAGARVGQDRREPGDRDATAHRAVVVQVTEQRLGHVARRLRHELDRGELRRLVVVDPARELVADEHLDRRRDRRDRERDREAEPVVAVAAPAQHAGGVHRRDQEPADEVRGDEHVQGLVAASPC